MATLEHLLLQMAHADLRAIATRLRLRRRGQHSKAQWATAIAVAWRDEQQRRAWLAGLTPGAYAALMRLAEAGELPAGLFWGTYGSVQRAAAARREQCKPWQAPQNAAEELFYIGLLHPLGARTLQRAARVQVASELRLLLAQGAANAVVEPQAQAAATLLHDLGQFLIYCHTRLDLRLLGRRWLRAGDLAALNGRLHRVQRQDRLHSHRRNSWLAFLALLGECAGLQDGGRITAAGWSWLRLEPPDQLAFVWQAWLKAAPELRLLFSGAPMNSSSLGGLLRCLPGKKVAFTARQLTSWFAAAGMHTYLDVAFSALPELEAAVRRLLVQELAYFGVVQPVAGAPHAQRRFTVTALGERLLGEQPVLLELAATVVLPAVIETWDARELQIKFSGYAVTAAQAVIAQYACHVQDEAPGGERRLVVHSYRLDQAGLQQAIANGCGLPSLMAALGEAGLRCTVEQGRLLAAWAASADAIRLHVQTLLETETPELLAELLRRPPIAGRLGRVLRPTVAVVKGSSTQLSQELRAAGYPARGGAARRKKAPGKAAAATEQVSSADLAALWLAGMVYAEVGRFAPLPAPPPYATLAALYERLSLLDRAAVESQLADAKANLLRWLDHFSYAPPPEASEPGRWIPMLQAAIDSGRMVDMHYFSAGRNLLVRYVVEPYWLEDHQGVPCLRGDPQGGGSEAILFRLDRIQSLAWVEPEHSPG